MGPALSIDGSAIVTRKRAERLVDEACTNHNSVLDLTTIEFVSRSVADELLHQQEERGVELRGLDDQVGEIVDAVSEGRKATA